MSASPPSPAIRPAMSFLYVPGDKPEMLAKATMRDAGAVIVDLEDAVALDAKTTARETAAEWLFGQEPGPTALWVRLNPHPDLQSLDLAAVVQPGLSGVYLPKVYSPSEVESVATQLDTLEARGGIEPGSIRIAPLLETAAGILAAPHIAASPRVSHLAIGEADLAADLGMHPSPDGRELNPIRTAIVVASAAAGLNPPIGPVETNFRDLDSLRTTSGELRRMGYGGRAAIHPDQIPVINAAFAPTVEELEAARNLLDRFESAQSEGRAVTVAEDGSLIDEAVVRRARITLASQNQGHTER